MVNRVKSVVEGKRVAERVINIAGQFLNLKVDYLGFVYDDPVVHTSVVRQKPFLVLEPKSRAARVHPPPRRQAGELRVPGRERAFPSS